MIMELSTMTPMDVSTRIDRALRKDEGLQADIAGRDMPQEVTVTNELSEYFLFYDMTPNHAEATNMIVTRNTRDVST